MAKKNKSHALEQMKYEIASEFNIPFDTTGGDNGNLTARQAGSIGGQMTKRLVALAEQELAKKS